MVKYQGTSEKKEAFSCTCVMIKSRLCFPGGQDLHFEHDLHILSATDYNVNNKLL